MMWFKGGFWRRKAGQYTIKKGDVLLVLCVTAAALFMFWVIGGQPDGDRVRITADGQTSDYPLGTDRVISLKKGDKVCNSIVIRDGQVCMAAADCPDQICVHHKAIFRNGESIICLPNKVIVEVASSQHKEIDN